MATDDLGNQRIAYEWGNVPMQPNNDRNGINLGSKGIHSINGMAWDGFPTYANAGGHTLVDGDPLYIVPSYTFCWSNPKTKDGNVWDYIEYLRTVGVDPTLLVEATFDGVNKYDWGTIESTNDRLGGIIFWQYIPADAIIWIDWATGTVYTGKDFNDTISAMYSNAGDEVSVANDWYYHSVVALTNDPAKNNTANWWY
jgi:hypothetical protein